MKKIISVSLLWPLLSFSSPQCPSNSSPAVIGQGCSCDLGYELQGKQCVKMDIPENASASILGGWDCDTGYEERGNQCVKAHLPKNADFTYDANWECKQGYQRNGQECDKVELPKNAHFIYGATWECNAGFVSTGKSCREMSRDELVNQVKSLNEMLYIQLSKPSNGSCSSGFNACKKECDIQFSSYNDQDKCAEACEEGNDRCN